MLKPLLALALLSLPLAAQVPFYSPVQLRPGLSGAKLTRMLDVNGDQRPDLVFFRFYNNGNNNYVVEYQLGLGNDLFGPEIIIDPSLDAKTLELADLDGDQRPDVVAGSDAAGIRAYRNTGSGFTEIQRITGFSTSSLVLADIDNDGDKDVVYSYSNAGSYAVKWRPNNGSGQFGAEQAVSSSLYTERLNLADADKDGDLDVIAFQVNAKTISWYPNNGSNGFGPARAIEGNLASMGFSDTADADNDGDVDLVVMAGSQGYLYRNNGSGTFTRSTIASSIGTMESVRFVRGDADVLPDLFYEANNALIYRRNQGGGSFAAEQNVPRPNTSWNTTELLVIDYDKDGREDVVSTEWGPNAVWLHRNITGSPPNIVSFGATDNTVNAGASATLTWNVEGATTIRIDGTVVAGTSLVVTPGPYDKTYTLTATNAGGTTTAKTTVFIPDTVFAGQVTLLNNGFSSSSNIDIGDIDGDGKVDIAFVYSMAGQVGWRAGAGGSFGAAQIIDPSAEAADGVLLVDIDKDGDKDLLTGFRYGVRLYRNHGTGQFAAPVLIANLGVNGIRQADFNGDGWPDLLLFERYAQPMRVVLNDGQGNLLPAVTAVARTCEDAVVADVDKDGLSDLLVRSTSSELLQLHRGTGPLAWGAAETVATFVSSQASFSYADINGDGFGDLLFKGNSLYGSDYIGIMLGRAGGAFTLSANRYQVPNLYGFTAGDFDGDLDIDIGFVTRSNSTTPNAAGWLEGDGFGKFSEPFIIPASPTESYIALAKDVDGDKDLDLVSLGANQILWDRNVTEHATVPVIDTFASQYPVIHRGESVDLSWAVTGDRYLSVSISGIGVVNGSSATVTPTGTTTYILSATNRGGTVTREITVTVVDTPVIHSFTSDKNDVDRTTKVDLSWLAAGADQLSINQGIGTVTGSTAPATLYQTTTFLLTATNEYGSDTKELTVAVNPALFRFAATIPGPAGMPAPTVQQTADFDLDGRPDVVAAAGVSTPAGRIYWIRSTGNGSFAPAQIIQSNNSYGANDITVADLNGDGRPDFASVSGSISSDTSGSLVQWFKSLPDGNWETMPLETAGPTTLGAIHAVDWDLDGDKDLVATAASWMTKVIWFQNLGGGTFAPRADLGGNFDQVNRIASADLDGDHDPDLVLSRSGSVGDLFALMNAGDGSIAEQRVLIPRSNVEQFDLGDLDGDKDIDLVATSANQVCERFLNDGSGHFNEALRLIPTQQVGAGMSLGDVDSDGDLDVVWLNGVYKWSENLGDGSFHNEEPSTTMQRALAGPPLLADFDGDGDLDAFGKAYTPNMKHDWFENLSTPASAPPVIAGFSASDPVIAPGKRLDLHWSVTGFPTSLEIVPAVQGTALALTQRDATVTSVATETETVQSYTLIARNSRGETRRELSLRVGNPPDIRSFAPVSAVINEGQSAILAWDIGRADQLVINGSLDASGRDHIGAAADTAPFTTYQIVATNIFGSSTASTTVEVNHAPVAVPLPPFTADPAGAPMEVETAPAFSDPDENDHLTWTLTGNTLPGLFSSIAIDPATGRLTAGFADYVDGVSLLTIRGTDRNGLHAETTLLVTLPQVPDPAVEPGVAAKREDGIFEQTLWVTNSGARAIGGFRIEIRGLPEGVSVKGAATPAAGKPWVLVVHEAVAAGASAQVNIEYSSTDSDVEGFTPQITVIQIAQPDEVAAAEGGTFQVDRLVRLEDSSMLLEWDAVPGRHYAVEYSALGTPASWTRSPVIVASACNRLQWLDQGPPKTETHPSTAPMRFYRLIELDEP